LDSSDSQYSPQLAAVVESLRRSTLNAQDAALQHKGYYENLDNPSRMSLQLWNVQAQRPKHWVGLSSTSAYRRRDDFLLGDLRPNVKIILMDQPLTTNQWGMRDREHPLVKPAGTYRIAVLGPSHVMGSGVADGETFSDFLEERLNGQTKPGTNICYEVLNFGVPAYSLLSQLFMLEDRAVKFQPDAIFITDGSRFKSAVIGHLLGVVLSRTSIPYPDLHALVSRTGVITSAGHGVPIPFASLRTLVTSLGLPARMPWREAEHRLRLIDDDVVRWTLGHMAAMIRKNGATPVFVALENVVDPPSEKIRALPEATAAGFLVFNLFDLWQNRDKSVLRIAASDNHPNAAANRLIADRLFELIQQHRPELRLETTDIYMKAVHESNH
jgi:hypothetical protein